MGKKGKRSMTSNYLLSLDLSTTCTGWAIYEISSKRLISYGIIKSTAKKINKLTYPEKQLLKIQNISIQIVELVLQWKPCMIIIEEINRHKSRMSGKTLDMLHGVLLYMFVDHNLIDRVLFFDSDGAIGWRTKLRLLMSAEDRLKNKERKKLNKKIAKGTKKLPIINKKHLACRYVNKRFGTNFDVDLNATDNDTVDAIGLGISFLLYGSK